MTDIRGYTIAQAKAFGAAAERARSRDLADQAYVARIAQYDQKNFAKAMKGMRGE